MNKSFLILFILGLLMLSGCAPHSPIPPHDDVPDVVDNPDNNDEPSLVFTNPVETNPRLNQFEPAFDGQTRVKGMITTSEWTHSIITDQLREPWGIDRLPDGTLVITEKQGSLRLVFNDGTVSSPIFGFPTLNSQGQGGLLDVAVSPNFSNDRTLFFTLSYQTNQGSLTAVARGELSIDYSRLDSVRLIHQAIPFFNGNGHFGSRIVIDDEGHLLVSTGDRQSSQVRGNAQRLDNGFGKILRLTQDGEPVSSNPFFNQSGYARFIYAYGLRNVQGLALHPLTRQLWASDHGPRAGDELNLIESGVNFGWPIISYGSEYSGADVGQGSAVQDGMAQPVYYWDPAIAPSGMVFYTSNVIPEWENNLFIGTLRGTHIVRLMIEDRRVVAEERLLESERQRFRDLTIGLHGELFAITDAGRLYRIGKP